MCSHDRRHADGIAIEHLGHEITELAAHIHAATCRWLGLVAEFDRRSGWAQWGCKSCAAFLSWRCAIAPGAAREHVRVARRLETLPLIRSAFAEGRLSYSKVRALTRVDAVEDEDGLLTLARHSTAAQLERMVRAYRGIVVSERAASGRPARYVTWEHADDGSFVLRARLAPEEGAIVIAALEAAVDRQRGDDADRVLHAPAETPRPGADAGSAVSADANVAGETPLSAAGAAGAEDVPAETRVSAAGAARGEEVPAEMPVPVAAGEGACVGEYVPAKTPLTIFERRADALVLMADTVLAGEVDARRGGDRYQVVVHIGAAALAADGAEGPCELADGAALAGETARRLACDAAIVPLLERDGRPVSVGRKTRSVPPALRRALASRDRGCRFPGCADRCAVDAHHVRHWAHGGATSLDNLVQLCRHHHRLVHEGGYSVQRAGREFVFRRPDGRPLPAVPRGPRGRLEKLREGNRQRGGAVGGDACVSESYERMNLGLCVDALLRYAPAEAPGI